MSVTLNQGLKPYQESITHETGSLTNYSKAYT